MIQYRLRHLLVGTTLIAALLCVMMVLKWALMAEAQKGHHRFALVFLAAHAVSVLTLFCVVCLSRCVLRLSILSISIALTCAFLCYFCAAATGAFSTLAWCIAERLRSAEVNLSTAFMVSSLLLNLVLMDFVPSLFLLAIYVLGFRPVVPVACPKAIRLTVPKEGV